MAVRHYEYMLGRTLKTMYCDLLTGADACLQLKCQVNSNVTLNSCTIKQSTGPIKQSTVCSLPIVKFNIHGLGTAVRTVVFHVD